MSAVEKTEYDPWNVIWEAWDIVGPGKDREKRAAEWLMQKRASKITSKDIRFWLRYGFEAALYRCSKNARDAVKGVKGGCWKAPEQNPPRKLTPDSTLLFLELFMWRGKSLSEYTGEGIEREARRCYAQSDEWRRDGDFFTWLSEQTPGDELVGDHVNSTEAKTYYDDEIREKDD